MLAVDIGTAGVFGEEKQFFFIPGKVIARDLSLGEIITVEMEAYFVGKDDVDRSWDWSREITKDGEYYTKFPSKDCKILRGVVVRAKTNLTATRAKVFISRG